MPAEMAVITGMASSALGAFEHMNARISLGRWSWVLVTPQMHRLHHSFAPEHIDRNFAQHFPIWDVLFGTYVAPRADEFPPTGTTDSYVPTVWQALAAPWGRTRR
jgi:sterol desaturase/sphingolipid hydroxylase (fatty acid hydroxylase superfamily)